MKKHRRVQFFLISIGLLLFMLTYLYYPTYKYKILNNNSVSVNIKKIETDKKTQSTSFQNMEYKGLYDFDKPFIIKSKTAYILNAEPDVVYMKNMHVILYLSDKRVVNITSDKGKYNKLTYDCFFEQNVKATDGNTKIFSENLDLVATENSAKIYNKVHLNHSAGYLLADKIDYDFETKNFNVSMFKNDKVKMKVIQ